MTPEERASGILAGGWKDRRDLELLLTVAIREAVKAERKECATLAEFGEWTPNGDDPYCGIQIADAIRARTL